jgi:RNA polymerase sigma-70 factor (ECF subfamily)
MGQVNARGSLRDLAIAACATPGPDTDALLAQVRIMALRYARARLGRYGVEDAAQDVAQEVCMAVLTALPTFVDRGLPFEAFVYSIAARKVADAQRLVMRTAAPMAQVPDRPDEQAGPEQCAVARDDAEHVMTHLAELPQAQREILILRVALGMSTEETAAALGMSTGAVRVAQHRALTTMRARVRDDGESQGRP